MKKRLTMLFTLMLITQGAFAFANTNVDTKTVLKVGEGKGSIAYSQRHEESEARGPESFVVTNSGDIYILDTLDKQVEIFDSKGNSTKTIQLELENAYFDVEVSGKGDVYVLACNGMIYIYNKSGDLENSYILEEDINGSKAMFYSLYLNQNDSVVLRNISTFEEVSVDRSIRRASMNNEKGLDSVIFEFGTRRDKKDEIILTHGKNTLVIDINSDTRVTPLMVTSDGDMVIHEQEFIESKSGILEDRVFRIMGNCKDYALAYSSSDNFTYPKKYLYSNHRGDVYQLIPQKDTVSIVKLNFTKEKQTKLKDTYTKVSNTISSNISTRSQTSSAAMLVGYEICDHDWTFEPLTMKTPYNGSTEPPGHLTGSSNSSEVGVPYKWGGFDDQYAFENKLDLGKTAGDINTSAVISSCTGIDCSGFIARAYGFSFKLGTKTIPSYFTEIEWYEIEQGDIANKYGDHVWMYISRNYDYLGRFVAYTTIESTKGGYEDEAKEWYRMPADANSYTPMKR